MRVVVAVVLLAVVALAASVSAESLEMSSKVARAFATASVGEKTAAEVLAAAPVTAPENVAEDMERNNRLAQRAFARAQALNAAFNKSPPRARQSTRAEPAVAAPSSDAESLIEARAEQIAGMRPRSMLPRFREMTLQPSSSSASSGSGSSGSGSGSGSGSASQSFNAGRALKDKIEQLNPKTSGQEYEDCMACRMVWKQVEMDVGNARYIEDVQASFERNCMDAQKSSIFYKACEDMYDDAYAMVDDYMSGDYTIDQMCIRARLCHV